MRQKISKYWLCQIGGWSLYIIVYTFLYLSFSETKRNDFFEVVFLDAIIGLLTTHLMRYFILRTGILKANLDRQILYMVLTTIGFSLLYSLMSIYVEESLGLTSERFQQYSFFNKMMYASFGCFIFLLIWNLIYFTYHYVEKSRQEQLDKVRLQSLVKEMELKTIKSHINPHFIFNALNSIRALVDEDPQRSRQAITELSNILRSSMQAEKVETAPFEKELNIVKDYLALEHIRFEDRLKVEFDIDEDTLCHPVPPMMLQTLVENAIKHGISKRIDGGVIKIKSDFRLDHHELVVQNTGHLNSEINPNGFGLYSTRSRLTLLYGEKAHFDIRNNAENMVEAVVSIPASIL